MSLPADVQEEIVRAIPGLERAEILRPAYAIEYDIVFPEQLDDTLEVRALPGLFLAGQINGTSGYEEAAGQGLVAGVERGARGAGERRARSSWAARGLHRGDDRRPRDARSRRAVPPPDLAGRAPAPARSRDRPTRG